ncbi:hypothetical protein BD309DRAFT_995378 [Dichomitus squalens]|nr:hypothetical protein BD309DRAFT_995378 [Dichomitus squalens]
MATSATELDIESFLREFLPAPEPTLPPPGESSYNPFSDLRDADNVSDQALSELFAVSIEFHSHRRGIDPFEFKDSKAHARLAKPCKRLFERLSAIAELVFAVQHRVFHFMLFVVGRRFRLLRWDRAGVVFTQSIDYYEHPGVLSNVFRRLSRLTDEALGLDPSATRLLPADIDFLRMDVASLKNPTDVSPVERKLEEMECQGPCTFDYSLQSHWPRYRLQIDDNTGSHAFLVGRPVFCANDLVGRGTRGYVALDCKTGGFVWLKDAWRASYVISGTEGDTLHKLNCAGVENVPTLVCHGDVHHQRTTTGDFWERHQQPLLPPDTHPPSSPFLTASSCTPCSSSQSSKKRKRVEESGFVEGSAYGPRASTKSDCPLRQHRHYRIAVYEFQHGQQLLSIVLDCLRAHHQAATNPKTQLLHRYISGGNILIYPKVRRDEDGQNPSLVWSGILSDWELSKPVGVQEAASRATQAERMGTYQFMSVNLLTNITKPVEISDELESFFHVLVYYAIRYLHSNCKHVDSWVGNYFHTYAGPGRMLCCGQKSTTIEFTGQLRTRVLEGPLLFHSPMDFVLGTILKSLTAHYKVMQYEAMQASPPSPRPQRKPLREEPYVPVGFVPSTSKYKDHPQVAQWEAQWESETLMDRSPTPEDRELATKVADHEFMLGLLARQIWNSRWRIDDRMPKAQVSDGGTHANAKSRSPETPPQAAPASNKRQRTSGPGRNISLPAHLHTSARRTRSWARTLPIRRGAKT